MACASALVDVGSFSTCLRTEHIVSATVRSSAYFPGLCWGVHYGKHLWCHSGTACNTCLCCLLWSSFTYPVHLRLIWDTIPPLADKIAAPATL